MAGMWITRLGITTTPVTAMAKADPPPVTLRRDIWSSLPDDVLDRVIARLPLPTLIRMQTVCKKWRIKLRTGSFIRLCEAEAPSSSSLSSSSSSLPRTEWFLTFGNQTKTGTVCFAYDVHLSKWHSLPLGFLPFDITTQSPLAAADGLICLGAGWRATSLRFALPSKLVICNPVSRFWRDVPLPPQLDPATSIYSVAGLVVDRLAGTYKVIVVGEMRKLETSLVVAYIFDSVQQLWKSHEVELEPWDSFTSFLASRFLILASHSLRAVLCSVVCEDILYCLTARPFQLNSFNMVTQGWNRVKISLPAEISGPSLVARPRRLFLVGAYRHNQHDKGNNIGIWELDHEARRWNVVDILLEAMRNRKSPPKSPPRESIGSSSSSSSSSSSQDVVLFVRWASRFLAYNVSKKSWLWLPVCIPSAQGSPSYHNGFLFCPSLLLP